MFDRLRDALRAALDTSSPGDLRELARRMREAVIERQSVGPPIASLVELRHRGEHTRHHVRTPGGIISE